MEFKFNQKSLLNEDFLAIGLCEEDKLENVIEASVNIDPDRLSELIVQLNQTIKYEGFTPKANKNLIMPYFLDSDLKKVVIYGLGESKNLNYSLIRKFASFLARSVNSKTKSLSVFLPNSNSLDRKASFQVFVESFNLTNYKFDKYKSAMPDKNSIVESIEFIGVETGISEFKNSCHNGEYVADSVNMARNLINEPANNMTPEIFAEYAKQIAGGLDLSIEVLDRNKIQALNMNLLLSVGQGAINEPKFVILKYQGNSSEAYDYGLAGKGITFDSGGLSLKPAASMEHMKYDMSGAAIVLAVMKTIAQIKPKFNIMAVMPLAENMPGSKAIRPGDIISSMSGKTVEVNNTDAEGRLVLADALWYLSTKNVKEILDVATLTGAVLTALGKVACGVMSNSQDMVARLNKIMNISGEKFWQLPLFEEYKESLKSDLANLKNAGSRGEAPTSCAALFLQEFINDKNWLHFDIANVGWSDKDKDDLSKGPTAYGARLIVYYLLSEYFFDTK